MSDGDPDRLHRFVRTRLQNAGRQYEEARQAFIEARREALEDETERTARIVCRRYAERRVVGIDRTGRPSCFEPDHHDCEGCVEDVRAGRIETW